jgi:DivIVA domain-containing protein
MSPVGSPRPLRQDEVRRKNFTVRFRGFDPNEVRGFLNAVADDLVRLYEQIATLTEDNGRMHGELQHIEDQLENAQGKLQHAQTDPQEQVTDQAVLLLNQAQQLADALIDEGMQSARDMLLAARSHHRDVIVPGGEADLGGAVQVIAPANDVIRHEAYRSADVDDVRMFAKVAQVQFRAVLDALDEQVSRLGQYPETPSVSSWPAK